MKLLEWEVPEDNYQEQIIIPKAIRDIQLLIKSCWGQILIINYRLSN